MPPWAPPTHALACIYAKRRWCWQRTYKIDESKCAACIAARLSYGDSAKRQPLIEKPKWSV